MFPFRQSIVFQQAQLPVIFTVDQCSVFFSYVSILTKSLNKTPSQRQNFLITVLHTKFRNHKTLTLIVKMETTIVLS